MSTRKATTTKATVPPSAPPRKPAREIGTVMKDGTVYAGLSPTTHKPMYVAPAASAKTMPFNKAAAYAKSLEVGGKKDFRVPTMAELRVLFANRNKGALKGTFNEAAKGKARDAKAYYWSSTPVYGGEVYWNQRMSPNVLHDPKRDNNAFVRCVR